MKTLILALVFWGVIQDPVAPSATPASRPLAQDAATKPAETDTVPLISAGDAGKYVDQKVTVKFEVLSSKLLKNQALCFLNSKANHRDPDDFAVVLKEKGLAAFKELKVDDPAEFFRGKTIAVTGKIVPFRGKPQIEVESIDQIRVVVVVTEESTSGGNSPAASAPPTTAEPRQDTNAGEKRSGDDDGHPQ